MAHDSGFRLFFCVISERSEEPRIFLGANYRTLNHGATAANAGCSRVQ